MGHPGMLLVVWAGQQEAGPQMGAGTLGAGGGRRNRVSVWADGGWCWEQCMEVPVWDPTQPGKRRNQDTNSFTARAVALV